MSRRLPKTFPVLLKGIPMNRITGCSLLCLAVFFGSCFDYPPCFAQQAPPASPQLKVKQLSALLRQRNKALRDVAKTTQQGPDFERISALGDVTHIALVEVGSITTQLELYAAVRTASDRTR